ncbi:MAG: bile acid:sodium symporter [Nannocystaceae bacterium]
MLSGFEQALLALLLVVLMIGMGSTLTIDAFRDVARSPRGPLVGLVSQYGWMPLLAYLLARGLDLPPEMAIGLCVVGCTPGGTTSNLFTYYARADLALSISMTAVSSVAAVVMMPLMLRIYAAPFAAEFPGAALAIPYRSIVVTLALMLVPMAIGMVIRARRPAAAPKVEKVGSYAGLGVLALLIATGLARNGDLLLESPPAIVVAALGLGLGGYALGYLGAALLRLGVPQRRAVAFETGIQNSPLALTILVTSFPEALHVKMLWLPLLYALLVIASSAVIAMILRRRA